MVGRFRRLFRARVWDVVVVLLGLLSFSVYFMHQNGLGYDAKPRRLGQATTTHLHDTLRGVKTAKQKALNRTTESFRALQYLRKVEQSLARSRRHLRESVLVIGEPGIMGHNLPLYKRAFQDRGYSVRVQNPFNSSPGFHSNWTILLCFSYGDGDGAGCWQRGDLIQLKKGQKVSHIFGMRDVLWRRDAFCYTTNEARRVPALRRDPVSPPCWLLPSQFDEFLGVVDALDSDIRWVFKSPSPGGDKQLLQPTRDSDFFQIKRYYTTRAIGQQYFPNPLIVDDHLVSVQLYALVTSITPLRVFLHSVGLVQYRFSSKRGFRKVPEKPITLSRLLERLVDDYGHETDVLVWRRLQSVVAKTMLISERFITTVHTDNLTQAFRCEDCFQLFSIDVILNSTLHPMVMEVNGQPALPEDPSLSHRIISDTVNLLLADGSMYRQLYKDLQQLNLKVAFKGINCRPHHDYCLTISDVEYLLVTEQQHRERGGYKLIYPSAAGDGYSSVIRDLYRSPLRPFIQSPALPNPRSDHNEKHTSAGLHGLLAALEQIRVKSRSSNIREKNCPNPSDFDATISGSDAWLEEHMPRIPCSHDEATLPLLAGIYTDPPLNVTPTFDPETTDYYVSVPYDLLSIKVWGAAMSCSCEARSSNELGPSSPASYTLGIGVNRINLLTVDITHSVPWVISTYTLCIARQQRAADPTSEKPHVCSLKQDCDLRFLEDVDCGLTIVPDVRWHDVITDHALPYCQSADVSGRWLVPCGSCSRPESCSWVEARWLPYLCGYRQLTFLEGQECLAGKKLLFIGDSTNRGIMYYLIQRINGTLQQWDKTHQIKSYSNLNNNRTSVSFAYYPQFWLPAEHRPALDRTVHEIIRRSQPVEDGSNTILVIGGVHWMDGRHLRLVERALEREGLTNIHRVMKSLGAGFHQPVDGVHNLTLDEQRSLFHHNQELSQFATSLGYQVVDTFNMTMARFTDFRPGTCSCHFHEVVEQDQYQDEIQGRSNTENGVEFDAPLGVFHNPALDSWHQPSSYRVVGDINAIYSEILLSSICGAL